MCVCVAWCVIGYTNQVATSGPTLLLKANNPSSNGTHYMNILYSIDDWEFTELAVLDNTTQLRLMPTGGKNVGQNETHNLTVMIYNSWWVE